LYLTFISKQHGGGGNSPGFVLEKTGGDKKSTTLSTHGTNEICKKNFSRKPTEKRLPRRLVNRCSDNIKTDKEAG
jgi:hypothetical protein